MITHTWSELDPKTMTYKLVSRLVIEVEQTVVPGVYNRHRAEIAESAEKIIHYKLYGEQDVYVEVPPESTYSVICDCQSIISGAKLRLRKLT